MPKKEKKKMLAVGVGARRDAIPVTFLPCQRARARLRERERERERERGYMCVRTNGHVRACMHACVHVSSRALVGARASCVSAFKSNIQGGGRKFVGHIKCPFGSQISSESPKIVILSE